MDKLVLENKEVLEYLRDIITSSKISKEDIDSHMLHHNTSYGSAASIIRNGILSLQKLNELHIFDIDDKYLEIASDIDSHINGIDGISFAKVGLTDLYRDEFEYCPLDPRTVDFQVNGIKAYRKSEHYGNEFVAYESVMPDKFQSIDIRILEFIDKVCMENHANSEELIQKMNAIRQMAIAIRERKLSSPLRETSYNDNSCLDIEKLAQTKELVLKK